MLDGRMVAGAPEVGAQFEETVVEFLTTRDTTGFAQNKMNELTERHVREGGSVFLLEPNVKEGQGGLRDVHTLLWIARVLAGVVVLGDLEASGLATAREQARLVEARDFLMRVRTALHILTRFKSDKLTFELQEKVADRFLSLIHI